MVYIDHRVVVERRSVGQLRPAEPEIVRARVLPPGRERLLVEVGAVTVIVEPQTEAGAGQSKRPDLGVLSMAPDRCGEPLLAEVLGDS